MKKIPKMNEAAWLLYMVFCAFGVALCTKAGFGLSMIAAPSYILHVFLSQYFPFFTQGVTESVWQALVLVLVGAVLRRFRWSYLFCFFSAFVFGIVLDGWFFLLGGNGVYAPLWARIVAFAVGEVAISLGVGLSFRSYVPPQSPDFVVVEIANQCKRDISKVKLATDISFLVLSLVLSLTLTRGLTGIGIGTVVATVVNAALIRFFGGLSDKILSFEPAFPKLKKIFEK